MTEKRQAELHRIPPVWPTSRLYPVHGTKCWPEPLSVLFEWPKKNHVSNIWKCGAKYTHRKKKKAFQGNNTVLMLKRGKGNWKEWKEIAKCTFYLNHGICFGKARGSNLHPELHVSQTAGPCGPGLPRCPRLIRIAEWVCGLWYSLWLKNYTSFGVLFATNLIHPSKAFRIEKKNWHHFISDRFFSDKLFSPEAHPTCKSPNDSQFPFFINKCVGGLCSFLKYHSPVLPASTDSSKSGDF